MDDAFVALATDAVFHYSFTWNHGFLRNPNFVMPFMAAMQAWALSIHAMLYFPLFRTVMALLLEWLITWKNADF